MPSALLPRLQDSVQDKQNLHQFSDVHGKHSGMHLEMVHVHTGAEMHMFYFVFQALTQQDRSKIVKISLLPRVMIATVFPC